MTYNVCYDNSYLVCQFVSPITIGKHIDLRYLFSVNILYFFNIAIFFKKAMNVNQNSSTES